MGLLFFWIFFFGFDEVNACVSENEDIHKDDESVDKIL